MLRLQLANGLLYEMHLHGDIDTALQYLPRVARWLHCQPYQVDLFERHDAFLTGLINAGRPGDAMCTVQLAKYAPIAPPPVVSPRLRQSMALAMLNLLRQDYGFDALDALPPALHDQLDASMTAAHLEIQKYVAGLDQAALRMVRNFQGTYHRRYDDLKVYNFLVAGNREHSRNRIQAVQELPWLLRILSGMDQMHSYDVGDAPVSRRTNPRHVRAIIGAIDAGDPLFAAIANTFGVPKETVRWTRHQMLPHREAFAVPRMDLLLSMLSWLPPEKRPLTDDDWRSMRFVMTALLTVLTALWDDATVADLLTTEPRCGAILARWLREVARPTLGAASARIHRMRQAGDDPDGLKEYARALLRGLRRFCLNGAAERGDAADAHRDALLDWFATQSFHRLMACSRRWHAFMLLHPVQQAEARPGRTSLPVASWPAVLPRPIQLGSVTVRELTDSVSLVDEGRGMRHCVGGYSWECAMGSAMIVSLRTIDGRRLSTAEFCIEDDPVAVVLQQHKGVQNTPAPPECDVVLNRLVMLLNGPDYHARLAARRAFQQARRRQYEAMREQMPDSVEHVRRVEEYVAWQCTFGTPPAERTVPLRAILQSGGPVSATVAATDR
ncbi:MAG TPA: PcfJ domain-containing protein [Noviherbaspirillum sp.]|nr:PcfJ domain-containing protein [Noviherbaspirillum sp.]